ncbi:MAG: HAMP domain-containing sensor histidine kinase [Prolixibacteraceae bacterium]
MEPNFQREYEQVLAEKNRLEQQNQLKDKLLHMIGHDLRSPLGSIKMILDFVDQKIIDPTSSDFQDMLPELTDAADEAFYLLENLLYWTRIQTRRVSYQAENYSARQLVGKVITNIKRSFDQKGVRISNQIRGEYLVAVDEYLFLVIFRNLLSNACKYSKEGMEVSISLSESPGQLTFIIRDNGIGIKEQDLPKIRDANTFYTTYGTNNESGNGLGLKVSDALTRINQGQLTLESQENNGTTVSVTFPAGVSSKQEN